MKRIAKKMFKTMEKEDVEVPEGLNQETQTIKK
jgi:hypothetical protein